jgi:Protein of unknown function (DUF1573)
MKTYRIFALTGILACFAVVLAEEKSILEDIGDFLKPSSSKKLHDDIAWMSQTQSIECREDQSSADFVFTVKNTSSSLLKITGVETSCGCTVVFFEKSEFAPGESRDLHATVNFGIDSGLLEKKLKVSIADPKGDHSKISTLLMRAKVPNIFYQNSTTLSWSKDDFAAPAEGAKKVKLKFLTDNGQRLVDERFNEGALFALSLVQSPAAGEIEAEIKARSGVDISAIHDTRADYFDLKFLYPNGGIRHYRIWALLTTSGNK